MGDSDDEREGRRGAGAGAARQPAHGNDDRHHGPASASPYGLSTLAPAISLVDVASEIERADTMIGAVAHSKLAVIAEQIRALQDKAREVLQEARRDLDLHRARCAFSRRVGHVYHLYRRDDGELYWSMVAPEEWGGAPPHEFVGSYRLGLDQSWTPVGDESDAAGVPAADELVRKLLP